MGKKADIGCKGDVIADFNQSWEVGIDVATLFHLKIATNNEPMFDQSLKVKGFKGVSNGT